LPPKYYVVGDQGYKLSTTVMIPFRVSCVRKLRTRVRSGIACTDFVLRCAMLCHAVPCCAVLVIQVTALTSSERIYYNYMQSKARRCVEQVMKSCHLHSSLPLTDCVMCVLLCVQTFGILKKMWRILDANTEQKKARKVVDTLVLILIPRVVWCFSRTCLSACACRADI
jgi:hypothetical protein